MDVDFKTHLTHFKTALEGRRQELRRLLARADEEAKSVEGAAAEAIDQAVTGYTKEILLSQGMREHALLRMIEESLARLELGNFGVCLSCSSRIGIARLKAVPWTRYCMECQSRLEGQNRS